MRGPWDFGFCFQDAGDFGKLMVYDDDCEWGLFLRFLKCPEVSTVYITGVYGSSFDGLKPWEQSPYEEFTDVSQLEERFWQYVMPKLFPGYDVAPFSQHEFDMYKHKIRTEVRERATALTALFPYNVVQAILRDELPSWLDYVHTPEAGFPIIQETHHEFMEEHFCDLPRDNEDSVVVSINV